MIVTPWETMTCADNSHEWDDEILTMPTDATATIAEHGLFDSRICERCQISQRRFWVPETPEDGELLIAKEREAMARERDLK